MAIKWDDKTVEDTGGDFSGFDKDLEKGIKLRAKAKSLEDEFKATKEQADALLGPAFMAQGLKRVGIVGVGAVYQATGTNTSISGDKVKEFLVSKGISPDLAREAVEAGTSKKQYTYFQLRDK